MMKTVLNTTCALLLGVMGASAQMITSDTNHADSSTVDVQYLSSSVEGQYRIQHLADTTLLIGKRDTLADGRIPAKLRRVLKKDEQYKGWETAGVYLDQSTSLYMVSVSQGNASRTYGFNVYGKPVMVTESFRKGEVLRAAGGE